MKAVRLRSVRNAGWLKKCYAALKGTHSLFNSLLKALGHERLDKPFAAAEGLDLCVDLIEQVSEIGGVSGAHIMVWRMEDRIGEIVTRFNASGGREPGRPAV